MVGLLPSILAVPPVALVPYQFKVWPVNDVAFNVSALMLLQYAVSFTVGLAGAGLIFTVILALGLSQLVVLFIWDT